MIVKILLWLVWRRAVGFFAILLYLEVNIMPFKFCVIVAGDVCRHCANLSVRVIYTYLSYILTAQDITNLVENIKF